MPVDAADRRHSRQLLVLAYLVLALATVWSLRTPVGANSDRYDYAGRAENLLEGNGASPALIYPLRLAFDGAETWPVRNLTRPPLWPTLLAACMRLGAGDTAGVWMSAVGAALLLGLIATVGDRSFGAGAGGFAALVFATSFSTVRSLWGGGPEIALAALTFLLWTWSPAGQGIRGYAVAGVSYGLLPWLHPIGFLYAALTFFARNHRYSPRGRVLIVVVALGLALPWYLQVGTVTGTPLGPLQSQAELAKATEDLGGLGPYRTLEPRPTMEVLRGAPGPVLRAWFSHGLDLLRHFDAWMGWLVALLALWGTRRDARLALGDLVVLALAFAAVALVARDARLLVPMLPVAAVWSGAGWGRLRATRPRAAGVLGATILVGLAWGIPLGASLRPGKEIADADPGRLRPPDELVARLATRLQPRTALFTDSAVLAHRLGHPASFLPDSPSTLERMRELPLMDGPLLLALTHGVEGPWMAERADPWRAWLERAHVDTLESGSTRILVVQERSDPPRAAVYVPERLALTAEDRPPDLVEIPVPPATREGLRLREATWEALRRLLDAAAEDGVHPRVVSAYRPYEYQAQLHARAVEKHGEDQAWVAAPGTSEHQLGTTVDLADAGLRKVLEPGFADTPEGRWIATHARDFGFVLSYTPENENLSGYRPEPWHLRHRPELFPGAPTDEALDQP